jgi:hypothetical protein
MVEHIFIIIGLILIIICSEKTDYDWYNTTKKANVSSANKIGAYIINYIHDIFVLLFPLIIIYCIVYILFFKSKLPVYVIIIINIFMYVYYLQFAFVEMCSLTWIYNNLLNLPQDTPYHNLLRDLNMNISRKYNNLEGSHYKNTLEWVNGNIATFILVGIMNIIYLIRG